MAPFSGPSSAWTAFPAATSVTPIPGSRLRCATRETPAASIASPSRADVWSARAVGAPHWRTGSDEIGEANAFVKPHTQPTVVELRRLYRALRRFWITLERDQGLSLFTPRAFRDVVVASLTIAEGLHLI